MKKQSILQDKDAVFEAASTSGSIKEAVVKLGLRAAGGNCEAFKRACQRFNIDIPKYDYKKTNNLRPRRAIPVEEIFIENSNYCNGTHIKKRLVSEFGWELKCMEKNCPSPEPIWNGKPLTIQLEHINGVHDDNRIENLLFLCPNCHSQTSTFAGRSKGSRS